jgi:biopolymer transport protein TolQ
MFLLGWVNMSGPTFFLAATPPPDTGLWAYFCDSNFSGQVIVGVLVLMSFLGWAVMLTKYLDLKKIREVNAFWERKLQSMRLGDATPLLSQRVVAPYALLLQEALKAQKVQEALSGGAGPFVAHALERKVTEQVLFYESKMTLLATIISGAPFLGLLGTVWGVMDAFGSVALQASVTLQMLAPGVSGALLTTVAALLVAIPSVFGYNYLLREIRSLTVQLENFASWIEDRLMLEAMEQAGNPRELAFENVLS